MKFKVGDLVVLSAAGRRVDQNSHAVGGWGIIKEIYTVNPFKRTGEHYPIKAQWYNGEGFGRDNTRNVHFKPYELKFFKKTS